MRERLADDFRGILRRQQTQAASVCLHEPSPLCRQVTSPFDFYLLSNPAMLPTPISQHTDFTLGSSPCVVPAPSLPRPLPPPPPLPRVATCRVWGTDFAQLDMPQTVALADAVVQHRSPQYFVTANLNYLMLTEQHPRLAEINAGSIAVLADGQPIVRRSQRLPNPLPGRVAGADLIVELSQLAAVRGYRVFFLGAAEGVAQAAAAELQRRFPTLQIAGCYAPPYRPLTAAEHDDILARIRQAETDILLVAFGQPKGEFWIYDNLSQLQVPLSIQLGASFDFLAGTARRAPAVWQRCGCEWLYRALSDPRRLLPRYARNLAFLLKCWLRAKS